MPIYEYRCNSCGHQLEKIQRMSDDPLTDCPSCEKSALRRLISPAGFRLKGSGWYETDFKTGSKRNVAGADSEDKKKSPDKSESGSKDTSKSDSSSDSGKTQKAGSEASGKSAGKDKSAA
ncbi:MAG TPA: zinc ribbon domain-containing protein [Xanthomonadales bacterium]|nr:zinc ribbon domain-containing protein [Xanthomonadales bacterium]